jgi:hypothetical protein
MLIEISPDGDISFIYKDELRGLMTIGKSTVKRLRENGPPISQGSAVLF